MPNDSATPTTSKLPERGSSSTHDVVGTVTTLPTTSCVDDEPLSGSFDVVGVAESFGTRDGTPYLERATSEPFPVDLGGVDAVMQEPAAEVFACGQPGPESIHTLPDPGGLTLAVDLPAGPWDTRNEIVGTVGTTDGQRILGNISPGVRFALVGADGTVVGFVAASPGEDDVVFIETGPESPATIAATTFLTMCGQDGVSTLSNAEEGIAGTYTAWPFITGVVKEVTDAEGNATTPPADPVIVIANPQEITFGS